jgi:hypothetical protein
LITGILANPTTAKNKKQLYFTCGLAYMFPLFGHEHLEGKELVSHVISPE